MGGPAMPLVHISLRAGKPDAYRQAIFDSLYRAMREALNVSEDDQFMSISEHDAANFRYGPYLGIARSEDLVRSRSPCSTPAPRTRKKRCSGGSRSCSVKALASGRRTCSWVDDHAF